MAGLVEALFRRFEARQAHFFERLPQSAKQKFNEIENKYAELRVTGPEGGVFYIQYKNRHFRLLNELLPVPYEQLDKFLLDGDIINYPSGDLVLFDVVNRNLSPRAVIDHQLFRATTDKILYDTEEFAQTFEAFLDEMQMVLGK